jgi:BirA family biotin operon repressor/biotin-[acetyl-CoA-carboxylase] ligase
MNHIFPDSQIIRISQTTSTNHYLLQLSNVENLAEGTVVAADRQTHGRGQGDNRWESEPGANLTFSIILYPVFVKGSQQFILSKAISLAVYDFLSQYVSEVTIKWPNDVYVGEKKIAGILIENFIGGDCLTKTIAGIGLNINQTRFLSDAPNPVSLRQLTGKTCRLENCLNDLHERIAARYRMMIENADQLDSDYLKHLYRFGQLSGFSAGDVLFDAIITGVNEYGMLEMTTGCGERKVFGFKEVVFQLTIDMKM